MLRNFFITALRNLNKNRLYSLIKIFGLSLGLASCILMVLWIENERSYDRFHINLPELYRVNNALTHGPIDKMTTGCAFPVATTLKDEIPEIVGATKFWRSGVKLVSSGEKRFYEDKFFFANPDFFLMFSFELLLGNPSTALSTPQSIVLSESSARKYFGASDPIGQAITIDDSYIYRVSGVIKDLDSQSDFKFDFLASMESAAMQGAKTHWTAWMYSTYVQLNTHSSADETNSKLISWAADHGDKSSHYMLQPLKSVHLYGLGDKTKAHTLGIFSLLAFLILILACINYTNLNTAQISNRTREIGIRKVSGAARYKIMLQFLGESLLTSLFALLLALVMVIVFLPVFNTLVDQTITVSSLGESINLTIIVGLTIFAGILAGGIPSWIMSSIPTISVLKGLFKSDSNIKIQAWLGKILVIIQFTMAVALFIAAIVMKRQINYIQNKSLGFDKDNLIYIELKGENDLWEKYQVIKEEMLKIPGVVEITSSTNIPVGWVPSEFGGLDWPGKEKNTNLEMNHFAVDNNFLSVIGANLVEGRFFSQGMESDATAFVLNETAVKETGLKSPVGKSFRLLKKEGTIVGVVNDFHFSSLRNEVTPLILHTMPYHYWAYRQHLLIRLQEEPPESLFDALESTWNRTVPEYPFTYRYIDNRIENLYGTDNKHARILSLFTVLAICISCLGLFGLSSMLIAKRAREISIRKVHGASNPSLVKILFRGFIVWVVLANLISWPIAWFYMDKWLQQFAYKIKLTWDIYAIAALFSIGIAILTVIYEAVKTANANPIKGLSSE